MSDMCLFNGSDSIFHDYNISVNFAVAVEIGNINVCRRHGCFSVFVRNIAFCSLRFICKSYSHIFNRLILAIGNCSRYAIINVNHNTIGKHNIYLSLADSNKSSFVCN